MDNELTDTKNNKLHTVKLLAETAAKQVKVVFSLLANAKDRIYKVCVMCRTLNKLARLNHVLTAPLNGNMPPIIQSISES